MKTFLVGLLAGLFFALPSAAAEQIQIWNNETFTAPFTDGVMAVSADIPNNNDLNAIQIYVKYEGVTHSGAQANVCDCEIYTHLEAEVFSGVWVPIANQFDAYRVLDSGQERILIYSPQFVSNPGVDHIIQKPDGSDLRISNTHGVAPDKMRVTVTVVEYAPGVVQDITLSGYVRKFNE